MRCKTTNELEFFVKLCSTILMENVPQNYTTWGPKSSNCCDKHPLSATLALWVDINGFFFQQTCPTYYYS